MLKQSLYTGEAGPASVLVVDDEPFNIDLLCQELEEMGHNPVPAADGEAAMNMLAAKEVDLVLLDIMMPRMNGLQVLEALKEDGRLPNLPVIVVSAIDDIKSVARCIRLGAEDHLVKPFDPALLRARVEGTLEKKRLRDKVARQLEVTRALFGRYVPPGVAEHVLSGDGELVPVLREASVLFSDLVGFTAIAQHMTPAEVMDLLNAYFEVVIEPVHAHGGVVNEFMGDGMLISFNLPQPDPYHADNAVAAAFEIQEKLAKRSFGGHRLSARIGVHTGPVVAGNVAAGEHLHYTILGDAVNVAARLEEANKEYGTSVLVSAATASLLREDYRLERLGDTSIRGKTAPVPVYTRRQQATEPTS